jgi:hypothetical protein
MADGSYACPGFAHLGFLVCRDEARLGEGDQRDDCCSYMDEEVTRLILLLNSESRLPAIRVSCRTCRYCSVLENFEALAVFVECW